MKRRTKAKIKVYIDFGIGGLMVATAVSMMMYALATWPIAVSLAILAVNKAIESQRAENYKEIAVRLAALIMSEDPLGDEDEADVDEFSSKEGEFGVRFMRRRRAHADGPRQTETSEAKSDGEQGAKEDGRS